MGGVLGQLESQCFVHHLTKNYQTSVLLEQHDNTIKNGRYILAFIIHSKYFPNSDWLKAQA